MKERLPGNVAGDMNGATSVVVVIAKGIVAMSSLPAPSRLARSLGGLLALVSLGLSGPGLSGQDAQPPANGSCLGSVIPFETTTLEAILLEPGRVLEEGRDFWEGQKPLVLAQSWADEVGSRNPYRAFRGRVQALERRPAGEESTLSLTAMMNALRSSEEAWATRALPHLCSFFPVDVELNIPAFFVAFIPPRAFANTDGIVIDVAAEYWEGNPDNILNSLIHEFFHIGFGQTRQHRCEAPLENERLYGALEMLQSEGMAVWVAYSALEDFPAPNEVDNDLLENPEEVTRLLDAVNQLLSNSVSERVRNWGRLAWQIGVTNRGYYVVGAHMARTIEEELGREALIRTLTQGPLSYARLYNSLVPPEMQVQIPSTGG